MGRAQTTSAAIHTTRLITHAVAEIQAQGEREASLLAKRQRRRVPPRQAALAAVTVTLALALTMINLRHVVMSAPATAVTPAQMETGLDLAIGEAEEVFATTGSFPERLEIVDELQEGWSYQRVSPRRFRVSWSTPARTAVYDSAQQRLVFTDGDAS